MQVQQQICTLLLQMPGCWDLVEETDTKQLFAHLLRQGLALASSQRTKEFEAGVAFVHLVFGVAVLQQHLSIAVHATDGGVDVTVAPAAQTEDAAVAPGFVQQLVAVLQAQVAAAAADTVAAARCTPMFGVIMALDCIWKLVSPALVAAAPDAWNSVLETLTDAIFLAQQVALDILSTARASNDLECAQQLQLDGLDLPSAGADQHYVHGMAWRTLRGISGLLPAIVAKILPLDPGLPVMSSALLQRCGSWFQRVLTSCRHRGVIDACAEGLAALAATLMAHPTAAVHPRAWLEDALRLAWASDTLSVTRRGAGFPGLFQALASTAGAQEHQRVFEDILDIVDSPVPSAADDTTDLPQVRALNVLRGLFRDARLAESMRAFADRGLVVCLEGLASPLWAVRNVSTMVFGTLVDRLVRTKRVAADSAQVNSLTTAEFFRRCPSAEQQLLRLLTECAQQPPSRPGHPQLFAVLTLLCRLAPHPGIDDAAELARANRFCQPLRVLAGNCVAAVRRMAAQALMAFAGPPSADTAMAALQQLPDQPPLAWPHNQLHGHLLYLGHLLPGAPDPGLLVDALLARAWIGTGDGCATTRAAYWSLVRDVARLAPAIQRQAVHDTAQAELLAQLQTVQSSWPDYFSLLAALLECVHGTAAAGVVSETVARAVSEFGDVNLTVALCTHMADMVGAAAPPQWLAAWCADQLEQAVGSTSGTQTATAAVRVLNALPSSTLAAQLPAPRLQGLLVLAQRLYDSTFRRLAEQCLVLAGTLQSLVGFALPVAQAWLAQLHAALQYEATPEAKLAGLAALRRASGLLAWSAAHVAVRHSVLRLLLHALQDEDEDARAAAVDTVDMMQVAGASATAGWRTHNAAEAMRQCAQGFKPRSEAELPACLQALVELMQPTGTVPGAFQQPDDDPDLFEREDCNVYCEPLLVCQLAAAATLETLTHGSTVPNLGQPRSAPAMLVADAAVADQAVHVLCAAADRALGELAQVRVIMDARAAAGQLGCVSSRVLGSRPECVFLCQTLAVLTVAAFGLGALRPDLRPDDWSGPPAAVQLVPGVAELLAALAPHDVRLPPVAQLALFQTWQACFFFHPLGPSAALRHYAFVTSCFVSAMAGEAPSADLLAQLAGMPAPALPDAALPMPTNPFPSTSLALFLLGDPWRLLYDDEDHADDDDDDL